MKFKIGEFVVVSDGEEWMGVIVKQLPDGDWAVKDPKDGLIGYCNDRDLRKLTKLEKALK